jgi:hypothetical protein
MNVNVGLIKEGGHGLETGATEWDAFWGSASRASLNQFVC